MSRKLISLIVLCLCGITGYAQEGLVFTSRTWDFGTIPEEGGTVSHIFTGENRGDKPVVILDVVTTCGCTTPSFPKQPIPPGGKVEIAVTFDPKGRPGTNSKTLTVRSTAQNKIVKLTISGEVTPRVRSVEELYPEAVGDGLRLETLSREFSTIRAREGSTSTATMQRTIGYANTSAQPVRLELRLQKGTGMLVVEVPQEIAPGERGKIKLSYRPTFGVVHRYGTIGDRLEVIVNDRNTGVVISTSGIRVDDVSQQTTQSKNYPLSAISAHALDFGTIKRFGGPYIKEFTLSNTGQSDLIVRAVESSAPVGTSLAPGTRIAPNSSLSIRVEIDPAAAKSRVLRSSVMIVTNDPMSPVRTLWIYAVVED